MSEHPMGPGWWRASDGRWYPPEQHPATALQPVFQQSYPQPAQRSGSGFAQGLGVGTGCLVAVAVAFVLMVGGCGVLIALGGSQSPSDRSSRSGGQEQVEEAKDVVSIDVEPPDALGFVYVSVTVRNNSAKRSDYRMTIVLESSDRSTKYGDTFVWIRDVAPGQTTTEKGLPISANGVRDAVARIIEFDRTASI